jgi:adenylate kinase family enzyme
VSLQKNKIISIFGPDGVGKSTIASQLQRLGFEVFSGTGIASWPDNSWHEELLISGINDTTENNDRHFKEKIRRAHEPALNLSSKSNVVIDSDPLHKTLMHDYLKSENIQYLETRFNELSILANLNQSDARIHLQLKINEDLDDVQAARILQERITSRGKRAPFDPRTVAESARMIKASKLIGEILKRNGQRVISLATVVPISDGDLTELIKF